MYVYMKSRDSQTTASRTTLGPTQPPIQWVPGALSLGVKRSGREADRSLPSSAEVKECVELYLHSPNTPSWRARLKNIYRDNFTFYLYMADKLRTNYNGKDLNKIPAERVTDGQSCNNDCHWPKNQSH
jgi:hypothetical protein